MLIEQFWNKTWHFKYPRVARDDFILKSSRVGSHIKRKICQPSKRYGRSCDFQTDVRPNCGLIDERRQTQTTKNILEQMLSVGEDIDLTKLVRKTRQNQYYWYLMDTTKETTNGSHVDILMVGRNSNFDTISRLLFEYSHILKDLGNNFLFSR